MPGFGGYSPFPRRCGGGKARLQTLHQGLNAQRGTAYSQDRESTVWLENHAIARALDASWSTAQRLANQTIPSKMTDMLPRWERILAIPVDPVFTEAERRAEVGARMARLGLDVNHAHVYSEMSRILGDHFVAVEYLDISLAVITVPDGTYPFGTASTTAPWSSTVATVLVQMAQPTGYTVADFWRKRGLAGAALDAILPIWVSYTIYHAPVVGTPVVVSGGPSAAGFYLDEPNLDQLVFAT